MQQSRVTSNPPPPSSFSPLAFLIFDCGHPPPGWWRKSPHWLLQCQGKQMRLRAATSDCTVLSRREENSSAFDRRSSFCAHGESWIRIIFRYNFMEILLFAFCMLCFWVSVSIIYSSCCANVDGGFSFRVGPTHHHLENSHIFIEQNLPTQKQKQTRK